jgi:hypothetical protein
MFKLKGIIGGISLGKVYEGARGIGYKLGILRGKTSYETILSLPSVPKEDKEWYAGKEKEIKKAKQLKFEHDADLSIYANKVH